MIRGIVTTWTVGHRGAEALAGAVLASLLIAALGSQRIDLFATSQPPPLWAIYPGMMALVATTVGRDRLAVLTAGVPRRLARSRACWVAAIVLVTALLSDVVQAALAQRGIAVLTVGLTLVCVGLGSLWRPLGLCVAGVVEAWAVTQAPRGTFASAYPAVATLQRLGPHAVALWWAVVAACAVCYVWRGE